MIIPRSPFPEVAESGLGPNLNLSHTCLPAATIHTHRRENQESSRQNWWKTRKERRRRKEEREERKGKKTLQISLSVSILYNL